MSEQKDVSTKAEVLEILSRYLPPDLLAQVLTALDPEPPSYDDIYQVEAYRRESEQKRAEQLEQLLRDTLLYLKGLSDYNWHNAPKVIALQDRAAELGIVIEVQP